jgi:hypothetical protein
MTDRGSSRHSSKDDDTALLIAALEHSWAWYDSRINRGLQVINYYLVAIAVLATAYVSALNAKLYAVAVAIGLSGAVITFVSFAVGFRQRRMATLGEAALAEVQNRLADRLRIEELRMTGRWPGLGKPLGSPGAALPLAAFALAGLLNIAAVFYAVIR